MIQICKKRLMSFGVMLTLVFSMCFSTAVNAENVMQEGNSEGTTLGVSEDAEEIIGCLSIVAHYEEGGSFASGHCFLIFTSYKDGLTLQFEDLAGAYPFTEDFKERTKADISQLSWRYQETYFDELAPELAPGLSYFEYKTLSRDERKAQYPELYEALSARCDASNCFNAIMGEKGEDTRYQSMSYEHVMNSGDYITIGLYSDPETLQGFYDAVNNSTAYPYVKAAFEEGQIGDASFDDFMELFESEFEQYASGLITYEEIMIAITSFLSESVENYEETIMPYLLDNSFIDGDTTGGIYVNREMHDQEASWDQSPNIIYTIDVTQQQIDDLMKYENSGEANHYSLILHNCTVAAVDGWNQAVGYVRDENGENTSEKSVFYLSTEEQGYNIMEGRIDTPHGASDVLNAMGEKDLGGTVTSMDIVHGMEVPAVQTGGKTYDSIADAVSEADGSATAAEPAVIEILKDITLEEDLDISEKNVEFDISQGSISCGNYSIITGMGATAKIGASAAAQTAFLAGDDIIFKAEAKGGQLRYDKKVKNGVICGSFDKGEVTNKANGYDYADIRLQYEITLPQGVSLGDDSTDWSWNVKFNGKEKNVTGVNYTLKDAATNTYITNVVLTDVQVSAYSEYNFEACLSVSFEYNGHTYNFTQSSAAPLGRVIKDIANSYSDSELDADGRVYVEALKSLLND